ncbi:hypothetical protein B0T24DRAFT_599393 [Lasiosphaeria ovina]|uniref:Uncharacterized protein n=1 Tax=Lasiosphaeria ovina TaxID=92902 RepID=A0AAE0MZ24_9PEZI|nr:hypothetical protein B0T24DRAFT_599393 [Lasiosphaeria ovina]
MDTHALPEAGITVDVGAMQNQQETFAAIHALGQRIDAMGQQLNQRLDVLENRQKNFEIAALNSHVSTFGTLQPLVNIQNGGKIPGFPKVLPLLYSIDDATADNILAALGINLSLRTTLSFKRERIRRTWILSY